MPPVIYLLPTEPSPRTSPSIILLTESARARVSGRSAHEVRLHRIGKWRHHIYGANHWPEPVPHTKLPRQPGVGEDFTEGFDEASCRWTMGRGARKGIIGLSMCGR